ncbi:hypothetical protein PHAVU_006G139000 [Phaseolus vulgaris]
MVKREDSISGKVAFPLAHTHLATSVGGRAMTEEQQTLFTPGIGSILLKKGVQTLKVRQVDGGGGGGRGVTGGGGGETSGGGGEGETGGKIGGNNGGEIGGDNGGEIGGDEGGESGGEA